MASQDDRGGSFLALPETCCSAAIGAMGERWRPHRSAAVWYLWQSVRIVTPDGAKPASAPNPLIGSTARGKRG
jgi:hypothetical protein